MSDDFENKAGEYVGAILAAHEQITPWHPMDTAPRDKFARYRLANGSGEIKGCIDAIAPGQVWDSSIGKYWPSQHFNGWKSLEHEAGAN